MFPSLAGGAVSTMGSELVRWAAELDAIEEDDDMVILGITAGVMAALFLFTLVAARMVVGKKAARRERLRKSTMLRLTRRCTWRGHAAPVKLVAEPEEGTC
mmetsp:Transcript_23915/g.60872  ORF Transcript_23915/g.60872 Transcript_23915/m.60872 type:complete len:101 (+) Transcript_23915:48-350(+)